MAESLQNLNFLHLFYFWNVAREGSISAACGHLQISQPTISTQIRKLERALGQKLFERQGRGLKLTKVGATVFDYAEEIFALGRAMLGSLNGHAGEGRLRLTVGVPNWLPKSLTYRLLEPVLRSQDEVQIVCHEGDLNELFADLAIHRFDVIISDLPVAPTVRVKSYNHPLGDCGVAICGIKALCDRYRRGFPESLEGAPLLMPTANTELRRSLERWFDQRGITPRITAEFDDSALLKEFGRGGLGLFPVPAAVVEDVVEHYSVTLLGELTEVRARYFAISTERKLKHPAVLAIAEAAREGLLDA